ncbi:MAG: glycogen debranching enzyme N-terminal domain-containing protein, partial [Myxococcaceae bacterium]|nr:glycogen debranching enzyme N-terminal domain-containing protein [Myxococcaceae bacterium]
RVTHGGQFTAEGAGWYWNNEYDVERQRGLDFKEDLWCLGTLVLELARAAEIAFSVGEPAAGEPVAVSPAEVFQVKRADGQPTIIAGYPWFTDWGRDTMISLPGLMQGEAARSVIAAFVKHLDQGLIPNRFPDRGERPEYNTADATLWAFEAVARLGLEPSFFFEAAREIVAWHERGTHFGIHVDPTDGLVVNGPQTTWMDAVVDGRAITPRAGKAVEINALWFNALKLMEQWGLGDGYGAKAERVRRSFVRTFWSGSALKDLADDGACRPNQLFAVSLTHSPLAAPQQQAVVRACEAKLLTPFGLRTLAPGERGYVGRYGGSPLERDGAYHQGTVWPWLIGPYVKAHRRAFGSVPDVLRPLRELLEQNGTLPEVFDGDAPHRPGGTPAQAWSVAEVLSASQLTRRPRSARPSPSLHSLKRCRLPTRASRARPAHRSP